MSLQGAAGVLTDLQIGSGKLRCVNLGKAKYNHLAWVVAICCNGGVLSQVNVKKVQWIVPMQTLDGEERQQNGGSLRYLNQRLSTIPIFH